MAAAFDYFENFFSRINFQSSRKTISSKETRLFVLIYITWMQFYTAGLKIVKKSNVYNSKIYFETTSHEIDLFRILRDSHGIRWSDVLKQDYTYYGQYSALLFFRKDYRIWENPSIFHNQKLRISATKLYGSYIGDYQRNNFYIADRLQPFDYIWKTNIIATVLCFWNSNFGLRTDKF